MAIFGEAGRAESMEYAHHEIFAAPVSILAREMI
jgi:hypothetical protein